MYPAVPRVTGLNRFHCIHIIYTWASTNISSHLVPKASQYNNSIRPHLLPLYVAHMWCVACVHVQWSVEGKQKIVLVPHKSICTLVAIGLYQYWAVDTNFYTCMVARLYIMRQCLQELKSTSIKLHCKSDLFWQLLR